MRFMGIDPGLGGAIAVINEKLDPEVLVSMPTFRESKRTGKMQLDVRAIIDIVQGNLDQDEQLLVAIERVHPFPPKMGGVRQNFQAGFGYGLLSGVLAALEASAAHVPAREWQGIAYAGITGEGKARSFLAAERLFPDADLRRTPRCTTLDDGRADALLIAYWRADIWRRHKR